MKPGYPETRRDDTTEVLWGERIADPYRWLEDATQPEVRDWMQRQDVYARERLSALAGRVALERRLAELFYIDSISPPTHRGDRFFYARTHAHLDKPVAYVRRGADGPEEVLIDPNALSEDGSISLAGVFPSRDGRLFAYKLSRDNADAATLYLRDLDTGEELPRDTIEGAKYANPSWTPDSSGFYYTRLPTDPEIPLAELPGHAEVRFHRVGADPLDDELVHPATGDPTRFISAGVSWDGRFLHLTHQLAWNLTELWFRDLERGDPEFRPLVTGRRHMYSVHGRHGQLYVTTDDDAPNFRVLRVDPEHPDREDWTEIVPESDATLRGAQIIGEHLILLYLRNAHSAIHICDLDGKPVREIELPGLGSASALMGRPDEDEAYFGYSSFTEPMRIFKTSVSTGKTELWHTIEYPIDTSDFEVEQVWYASRDGTRVSMFVVHRKGIALDGRNPTLLTGYGGFMVSRTPDFVPTVALWVERGGVFALPNLRGGGEYGETWHRAGMLESKQNVFDDFLAAAEYLIDRGYTAPEKLAISGGSNGGLLVGAALTQRPDLFRAVVCSNPLLDMLRYHTAGSGKTWISEYGSAEDSEQFAWLRAYSPYHAIEDGASYPALLMHSAASDDRVDPMHARKFVAAMQAADAGERPVWLRVEPRAGHGGADMVRAAVAQGVATYAFLFDQLEIE